MNTQQHWKHFAEFCKWELASGGPDPQIPLVAKLSEGQSWNERVWRVGCYISVYNVPFAETIWENLPWTKVKNNPTIIGTWLHENWDKIVTRVERKTVRRPEWMYEYLESYWKFIRKELKPAIVHCQYMYPEERYLYFWDMTIKNIKRYGRYVALKTLESYNLFCSIPMKAPDIRPKDGWSPRITLGVLYPEYADLLNDNDNKDIEVVNAIVSDLQKVLQHKYNISVNLFQLQVMLCEYRESYHSKKQYPGRSLDSELGYWYKREKLWGKQSYSNNMMIARQKIFPLYHLGELRGWEGTRKECGKVLADYGYTWTDMLYDYQLSKDRMEMPMKWIEGTTLSQWVEGINLSPGRLV